MKARHVARELALLALFQMERHGALPAPAQDETPSIQSLIEDAVRALCDQAQTWIGEATEMLGLAADEIARLEGEHPDNLQTPLEAEPQPVALPTTRDVSRHLEASLQAARLLGEALRIPELAAHAGASTVRDYAARLIECARTHGAEIDALLAETSEDWKVSRMARMDRAILRLALAEMRYLNAGVDVGVSIDEAVRLAQDFSTPESYRFINGVLGKLASPETPLGPTNEETGAHV